MAGIAEQADLLLVASVCLAEPRIGARHVSRTIERAASARALLDAEYQPQSRDELIVCMRANSIRPELPGERRRVRGQLERWREHGLGLTTVLDEDYPLNLRSVRERPPFLFYQGGLRPADAYSVAIAGTRTPGDDGRRRARRLARQLCAHGVTVVSGLAEGIDTEAHRAALAAGGRTVAVLGFGLDHLPAAGDPELAEGIARRGAVVSQFFPAEPPAAERFRERNAVAAGIAQGTVVVEAGERSGARLQARLAAEQGKPPFLLRSLVEAEEWTTEFAARHGTVVVSELADVLRRLRPFDEIAAGRPGGWGAGGALLAGPWPGSAGPCQGRLTL